MLISAEHEVFLLINVKMLTTFGLQTFMSMKSSILGLSGPEKGWIYYICFLINI